jgi:hypothetical protein
MEKTLSVSFSANAMFIQYEVELNGHHKDILSVNETMYEEQAKKIADKIKWIKGFKRFSLGFGTIDWYESCNNFDVPYFVCSENGKRVKKDYITFNDIPKDWTVNYCLMMEIPSSIRGLNKFFEALKLDLTEEELKEIRKALKNKKSCTIDL